jgi:nucleotide-binding universal stress UspA family protein
LPESRFNRILFCTDFSESSEAAFEYALDSAIRRPHSVLYLLHIIEEPEAQFWKSYMAEVEDVNVQAKKAIDEKITATYLPRVPAGQDFRREFRVGPEAQTILEFAKATKIDVIVLGRHGHGRVGHAFFGSVAEKVVRKSACPVLVVPLLSK